MFTTFLAQVQQANLTDLDPNIIGIGGTTGALGIASAVAAWVRSVTSNLRAELVEANARIRAELEKTNARLDLLSDRIAAIDKQQGVDAVRVEGAADAIAALRQEIGRSVLGR
jgi:thioredoxin reductase